MRHQVENAIEQAFKIIAAAALDQVPRGQLDPGNKITTREAVDLIDGQLGVVRSLLDVRAQHAGPAGKRWRPL